MIVDTLETWSSIWDVPTRRTDPDQTAVFMSSKPLVIGRDAKYYLSAHGHHTLPAYYLSRYLKKRGKQYCKARSDLTTLVVGRIMPQLEHPSGSILKGFLWNFMLVSEL